VLEYSDECRIFEQVIEYSGMSHVLLAYKLCLFDAIHDLGAENAREEYSSEWWNIRTSVGTYLGEFRIFEQVIEYSGLSHCVSDVR
jgi:hypothetical protein